ncbi:MAG: calcium-translocating P-type ATPase, PMCA-type [Firmicutes bacterium]|nr:calcium-translocating P-type ATPase, PMCA-type [Bacillota bacterium]
MWQGLNKNAVEQNRRKYGDNKLTSVKTSSFFKLLLESLGDPIIKILLVALMIKLVFLFKDFDYFETLGILIAIFLASFISTISEYGSEAAFRRLQEESSKILVKVLRDGKTCEIPIEEVVVEDIVILQSGDKIPADGYLLKGNLSVDESSLNGETKEAKKYPPININKLDNNKLFRGSVVYNGEAYMKVTEVGDKTIYGALAKEVGEAAPASPLRLRLTGLAKFISKIGYFGAGLVTISYLFSVIVIDNNFNLELILKTLTNFKVMMDHLIYALTLSVTIIVVAVPEGLPMMITLVLSSNMKRMLNNNVLVRKLVGIETAGSINVLLTDKTGTLTKGKLDVSEVITGDNFHYKSLKEIKCNSKYYEKFYEGMFYNNESTFDENGKPIGGNQTDKACLNFLEVDNDIKRKIIVKVPFNSQNKYSSCKLDNNLTYIKGAVERLLPNIKYYLTKNGEEKVLVNKKLLTNNIDLLTKKGVRVLVLCYYKYNLNELVFIGFIAIKDELREEAKEGVSLIRSAGINTIMITGDAKETAKSIAGEVGLLDNDDLVLTSDEMNKLSDEDLKKIIGRLRVVARALPTDKSRLVRILEEMDLIVGMTGDGVNDAPALKKANVGFAMGSGTEVAKEASDIVILDDNILSISKAILYGRTIFKSIRKFIIYQLTVNMCALILSIVGPFIGINTPITIIQMLWLNMIMDTFAGLAFSFEPALKSYMHEPPKRKDEPIINSYMIGEVLFTGLYSAILCILFLKLPIVKEFIREGENSKYLMTAYFALFIFIGVFNSFNARSERINILANLKKNKVFIFIIIFILTVQVYLIYHGGDLFRTYGLTAKEFFIVLVLALTVFPVDFLRKIYLRKKHLKTGV